LLYRKLIPGDVLFYFFDRFFDLFGLFVDISKLFEVFSVQSAGWTPFVFPER